MNPRREALTPRALRSEKAGHLPCDPTRSVCGLSPLAAPQSPRQPWENCSCGSVHGWIPLCEADPYLQDAGQREQREPWSRPSPPHPPKGPWLLPHGPLCCSGRPAAAQERSEENGGGGVGRAAGPQRPRESALTWTRRGAAGRSRNALSAGSCSLELTGL